MMRNFNEEVGILPYVCSSKDVHSLFLNNFRSDHNAFWENVHRLSFSLWLITSVIVTKIVPLAYVAGVSSKFSLNPLVRPLICQISSTKLL